MALLAACGNKDLSNSCLPLHAPTEVQLTVALPYPPGIKTDFWLDPANPSRIDPILPVGTVLRITQITQRVAIDSPGQDIQVLGRLKDGRTFVYRWGSGRTLYRAPWEPHQTPAVRKVASANI